MKTYLATAWEKRSDNAVVTSPRDAIILASIVEKETGVPQERRMGGGCAIQPGADRHGARRRRNDDLSDNQG